MADHAQTSPRHADSEIVNPVDRGPRDRSDDWETEAMKNREIVELKSQDEAIEYYEDFFEVQEDYLQAWWQPHQFVKLKDVLDAMKIAPGSRIFDFGCGVGDVTGRLAALVPGCPVTGSDISEKAVRQAAARHPGLRFVTRDEALRETELYDVVFSHHVFEHVFDLDESFLEITAKLKPGGKILIVVPCGNPGSLEHTLTATQPGGIDPNQGNRFIHDAVGHLRRLRTEDLAALAGRHGFQVADAFYADQYWGSVEWIARDGGRPFDLWFVPEKAVTPAAAEEVTRIRRELQPWFRTYGPFGKLKYKLAQRRKSPADWIKILAGICALPISYPANLMLWSRIRQEWRDRKTDPAGAEMWIVMERQPAN